MAREGPTPTPIVVHGDVFDRVIVTPHILGGSSVTWELDDKIDVEGPYAFYLEWAEHPDAEWVEVAGPAADSILVDTEQRRFSKLPHSVYRVRLETPTGLLYSDVNPLMGSWNRHDFLIAREVIRREYLALKRYTGTRGRYLARKQWGEVCTECTDYDTGQVTDAHCPTCFGTGIVGGYHAASDLWLGEDLKADREKREDGVGMVANIAQMARAVACPFLTSEDVWISLATDERWAIQQKRKLVMLRGKPLVWNVELRLVPPSDVIYTIPQDWDGGASSSSA